MTDQTEDANPIVGVVPGQGWTVEYRCQETDPPHRHSAPVIAWAVYADGLLVPLTIDTLDGQTTLENGDPIPPSGHRVTCPTGDWPRPNRRPSRTLPLH